MPVLADYSFGHISIDGEEHNRDVIVLPSRVVANWWRKEGHELVAEDLADVIEELPERLVVGCGADSRMRPDPKLLGMLRERGIDVEALPTAEAVERYAELEPAKAAAALHLTC